MNSVSTALPRRVVVNGCRLPTPEAHAAVPALDRFVAIPASPPSIDWSQAALPVIRDVEGNASYGDCVYAEEAHALAVYTGNANTLYAMTTAQTLAMYSDDTGFNPIDPATDQGADPLAALRQRVIKGYPDGSKLEAFATVDLTNQALVQYALSVFGPIKLWLALPDTYVTPFPSTDGFVWDVGTPNPNQGHCIGSCAYNSPKIVGANAQGLQIMTWGLVGTMTWAGAAHLCVPAVGGGGAIRVTKDWIGKTSGKTPLGLDYAGLVAAFNTYLGGHLPVPVVPPPAPVPGQSVSLAQAEALAAQAINAGRPLLTRAQAIAEVNAGLAKGWTKS